VSQGSVHGVPVHELFRSVESARVSKGARPPPLGRDDSSLFARRMIIGLE
jgi:hypothetical protein